MATLAALVVCSLFFACNFPESYSFSWPGLTNLPALSKPVSVTSLFKRSVSHINASQFLEDKELIQSAPKLIERAGYATEIHHVVTEDGFVLEMHRILKKNGGDPASKSAILIMHGYSCTSINWILHPADVALPFKLTETGYDVWLGNFRGNKYSNQHLLYKKDDPRYWNFSFHEMGVYDIPAMVDYILELKNAKELYYLAHSMGTTAFWVAMSVRPEYNIKIKTAFALAPIAYFQHLKHNAKVLAPILADRLALDVLGNKELVPTKVLDVVRTVGSALCRPPFRLSKFCNNVEQFVGSDRMNSTWMPALLQNYPDRSSTRTLMHYLQIIKTGRFAQYDFGYRENMRLYKQPLPPLYALSRITAPVAIYWSPVDWLVDAKDVQILVQQLPKVVIFHEINADVFNHLDFLNAVNADTVLYNEIMIAIESIECNQPK